ncbi:hypothetical protein Tco_0760279 [Tanacetum coccineum]
MGLHEMAMAAFKSQYIGIMHTWTTVKLQRAMVLKWKDGVDRKLQDSWYMWLAFDCVELNVHGGGSATFGNYNIHVNGLSITAVVIASSPEEQRNLAAFSIVEQPQQEYGSVIMTTLLSPESDDELGLSLRAAKRLRRQWSIGHREHIGVLLESVATVFLWDVATDWFTLCLGSLVLIGRTIG